MFKQIKTKNGILMNENNIKHLLGTNSRARRQGSFNNNLDQYFFNPIIHRETHGDEIYVPLDLNKNVQKSIIYGLLS
jgi:hypothetical protein